MIIHIKHREHPYAQIDKRTLYDPRLSWQATGLLSYLLSKPDNWHVCVKQLVHAKRNGRDAVQANLRELVENGYAQLITVRGEDGKILTRQYVVSECPGHWETLPEPPSDAAPPECPISPDCPLDCPMEEETCLQPAFPAEANPSEGFSHPTNNVCTNPDLDQERTPQDDFSSFLETEDEEERTKDEDAAPPPASPPEPSAPEAPPVAYAPGPALESPDVCADPAPEPSAVPEVAAAPRVPAIVLPRFTTPPLPPPEPSTAPEGAALPATCLPGRHHDWVIYGVEVYHCSLCYAKITEAAFKTLRHLEDPPHAPGS